jgi:hypothetical protein
MLPLHSRSRTAAAIVFLAVALRGTPARADGGENGAFAAQVFSALFWTTAAAAGVVTDAGIGYHLVWGGGRVPRSWAVTGTVLWSVATVALGASVVAGGGSQSEPSSSSDQAAGIALASGIFGVTGGSLALSLYGLSRPPEPTPRGSAAAPAGVSLGLPMVAPTRSGARLVLGGTF